MTERLHIIDGFRCIAILAVLSYHYLYRFNQPITNENNLPYDFSNSLAAYGFFGVQLFFVISGFVIYKTLKSTNSLKSFLLKRLIRLWPTLLLCGLVTYSAIEILANGDRLTILGPNSLTNFLPSLTFTPPALWSSLLDSNVVYVDGVYWSLTVEVIFYILAASLFYWRPESFLPNWLTFVLIATLIRMGSSPKLGFLFTYDINNLLNAVHQLYFKLTLNYFSYFSLGIFFYCIFSKHAVSWYSFSVIAVLTVLEFFFLPDFAQRELLGAVILLFLIFIFKTKWLNWLAWEPITWVGLISYPLYLLHQNIGVALVIRLHPFTVNYFDNRLLPLLTSILVILVASVIFQFFEKPLGQFLNQFVVRYKSIGNELRQS